MNQETIKHIHTRYMQGVGLTCLSRVYHEPITTIFHEIQNYQNKLDSGTDTSLDTNNNQRNRKTRVCSRSGSKVQNTTKRRQTKTENQIIKNINAS
jgi:hypothetical protein